MLIKLVLEENTINIVREYTPQIGLKESMKQRFWKDINEKIQGLPNRKKDFTVGDQNGHVGKDGGWV